jgi:hypothetical protein
MTNKTAVVFTAKSVERILNEGGTSSWRLDRNNARQCQFAVCTRNANADWVEGPEPHHAAFLIGKVQDVVPCPNSEGRYLILFSEFARVNIPEVWKNDRNPFRYSSLDELGIDPSSLKWEPMPKTEKIYSASPLSIGNGGVSIRTVDDSITPLTMEDAKKGLALTFGVSPDSIEITVRG